MKLYRTITFEEFVDLLLGKTIFSRKQESGVCFRYLEGKEVSAADAPFHAVCTFKDSIFWAIEDRSQYIFLELDIPEDRILYNGYGIYSTPYYNSHFNKESYWMTNGTYGIARRALKDYKIPEVYISDYSERDILSISFSNGLNLNHSLEERRFLEESFQDGLFSSYVGTLARKIRKALIIRDREKKSLSNEQYLDLLNWTDLVDENPNIISLNIFKKMLKKRFPEKSEFISKFKYYEGVDNLESIIAKGKVSYESSLNVSSLLSILEETYNPTYEISLVGLKSLKEYPTKIKEYFKEMVSLVNVYKDYGIETIDTKRNEAEIMSLLYTLSLEKL